MIWITGDTHGSFVWLERFCSEKQTTTEDVMIVLGDAGINYFGPAKDDVLKRMIARLPITLFCIHGNHEMRPEHLYTYELVPWRGGQVWREPLFPTLLFARDGEVFDLDGAQTLVIGGAYSIDKGLRSAMGGHWWKDEQPDEIIRARTEAALEARGWAVDVVLSHTSPLRYEPVEAFMSGIDQSRVDKTTELWLDALEERLDYRRWFCGHFHTDKTLRLENERQIVFMMLDVLTWPGDGPAWNRLG